LSLDFEFHQAAELVLREEPRDGGGVGVLRVAGV
jgi:hypothetical protein